MTPKIQNPPIIIEFPAGWNFLAPFKADKMTRFGRNGDGGYLIPLDALKNVTALISMGIFKDWSFDRDIQKIIPDIQIHAYDHTISKLDFKRGYRRALVKFFKGKKSYKELMEEKALYASFCSFFTGKVKHFKERIHNRIDNPSDATLDTVFERIPSNCIILKIDIEGSEYRIINDILSHAKSIQVLIIEFHDTDPFLPIFFSSVKELQLHFDLVHLHANNYGNISINKLPEVIEMTFVKKGVLDLKEKRSMLPLYGIDQPCNLATPDYEIHFQDEEC